MSARRRVPIRVPVRVREGVGFGGVGAVAFVITAGTGNALHAGLGLGPLTSTGLATVVATTFAYAANRAWTFRHRARSGLRREYVLFCWLNAVGLAITELVVGVVHYTLHLRGAVAYNAALVLGVGIATVFRFWSYRRWVFLERSAGSAEPAREREPAVR
ncbi:Putative flippase GtrA (transmembrane translocase of bactoprenol-linked glucose) [Thermomonospora echinospora]|uniref:Putative flippase GtrA (Transmembrane translocase of bactoprenol-linked glucose) n=1 Tax=Thermomonospora echinospora TaxID=1992 RepID=A0A1H5VGN0_9ACTN|nr:GtrA family protein [Thermomonospora echinospora]SEF86364.1 Putative flippase GtrA (transmembrane translocase of bactoprenol-linked glucose) [Thermomonospora echinospora]